LNRSSKITAVSREPKGPRGQRAARSIDAFWLAAFIGCAAVALALVLGISAYWIEAERRLTSEYVADRATALVTELDRRADAVRRQLGHWAQDAGVRSALREGRPDALRAKEAELHALLPDALAIGLIRPVDAQPGGSAGERLSYAGLDMVRMVLASGRMAPLEVHRVRLSDEHIATAGPVLDEQGDVVGAIHVKLRMAMLPSFTQAKRNDAVFVFEQQVDNRIVPVGSTADAPRPSAVASYRVPVPDARIQLSAWVTSAGFWPKHALPWLAGLYCMALLGLALVLALARQSLKRAVTADLSALTAMVEDAAARKQPRLFANRVQDFRPVLEQVNRQLRAMRPPRPTPSGRPARSMSKATASNSAETYSTGPEMSSPSAPRSQPIADAAPGVANSVSRPPETAQASPEMRLTQVPDAIFRAYDIRGLVHRQIDSRVMYTLGRSVGSEALARNSTTVFVARDQRPTSASLCEALVQGLLATGADVIDLGLVPTPLLYFACGRRPEASAAMVTASHNPREYNGLKVVLAGMSATTADISALRDRIRDAKLRTGQGSYSRRDSIPAYIEAMAADISLARGMTLVVDCGHATASRVAPSLFRAIGCKVIERDCECDSALADAQMLDPAQPRQLSPLAEAVVAAQADLGLGFDADGDRLGVVDSRGAFIAADRLLMLLAADVLARHPGSPIIYDVKCSQHLAPEIERHGGRPVMWKSGHSNLKQKLRELDAPLAGELSGHIVFADRWNGFDDAHYAAGRLLEVLALDPRASHEVFAELPAGLSTPELFMPLTHDEAGRVMQSVLGMTDRLEGAKISTIDGLRVEHARGWGLVRASNTQSGLVFRFEADDQDALDRILGLFRHMMSTAAPGLGLPF
jgi:phosphomannomutase/phosphoglucomutase